MSLKTTFRAYARYAKFHCQKLCNTFAHTIMNADDKQSFEGALNENREYTSRFTRMTLTLQPEIVPLANALEGRHDIQSFYDLAKVIAKDFGPEWRNEYGEDVDGERAVNSFLYPHINYLSRTAQKFVDIYESSGDAVKSRLDSCFAQDGAGEVVSLVYFRDNMNNAELKKSLLGIKQVYDKQGIELK